MARALSSLPFFVFDRGHLAFVLRPFHDAASRHFYPGCEIGLLDPASRLTVAGLLPLAAAQPAKLFDPMFRNFSGASSPDEVIRALL